MVILLVLFVVMRLQFKIKPYKNPLINELEQREIRSTVVTFFATFFFVHPEIHDWVKQAAFTMIMAAIFYFFVLWLYCFLSFSNHKFLNKLSKFVKVMAFVPNDDQYQKLYKDFV